MATYSYYTDYQKQRMRANELEQALGLKDAEINALKEQLEVSQQDSSSSLVSEKISQYQQKIQELQARINELEEKLYKGNSSMENKKVEVHTRVIEAINRAFED